jgi:hypothetical protein
MGIRLADINLFWVANSKKILGPIDRHSDDCSAVGFLHLNLHHTTNVSYVDPQSTVFSPLHAQRNDVL